MANGDGEMPVPGASFPGGGLAVVIGATGGIGRALADRLEEAPAFAEVLRLGRSTTPAVELGDEETIAAAARTIAGRAAPLRLAIDATGFLHDARFHPEKSWRAVDPEHLAHAFAVNATGPALLMKHLLPRLAPGGKAVFATLSARVGSIGDNRAGGWLAYRASKAALNQIVRTMAIELARRRPDAVCVALHPGTVDTPLSSPFARSGLDVRSPDDAADDLLAVIERLTSADSGGFLSYSGEILPW